MSEAKKQRHLNFCECCDLTKKSISIVSGFALCMNFLWFYWQFWILYNEYIFQSPCFRWQKIYFLPSNGMYIIFGPGFEFRKIIHTHNTTFCGNNNGFTKMLVESWKSYYIVHDGFLELNFFKSWEKNYIVRKHSL